GWCQQMLGEYKRAIATYQSVQDLNEKGIYPRRDETWISTYNNLGQCYLYQRNIEQALEQFEHVIEEEPSNFTALCGAACCLRRLKRNAENITVDVVKQLIGEEKIGFEDFKRM